MVKKKNAKKACIRCKREYEATANFYASNSPMFDGRVPICKNCMKDIVNPNDLTTVKNVLRQIDKPFLTAVWNKALDSDKDTFGVYMRTISSLPQYKNLTNADSIEHEMSHTAHVTPKRQVADEYQDDDLVGDFVVTQELLLKWGTGYDAAEILRLETLYTQMIDTHDISAPQHKELLKLMCKLNLKMEKCLENNDYNGFSKLHDQYQKLLASSGFRPIDRKSGDEVTGMRTFSQIFEEVERDGFIEPWDIEVSQDIVDKTLQFLINYQKKLLHQEILIQPPHDTPRVGGDDE